MTGPEDLQSNRVRVPLPMRAEIFCCPVLECSWTASTADIMAAENTVTKASGPSIDEVVSAIARARATAVDAFLRKHLESHDVIDYLRTIRDLEQQLYNAGHTGVRPHRRTTELPEHELVRQRDTALAERWAHSYDEALVNRGPLPPHRLEDMTGEQRAKAAETLQRYQEIDREPGWP